MLTEIILPDRSCGGNTDSDLASAASSINGGRLAWKERKQRQTMPTQTIACTLFPKMVCAIDGSQRSLVARMGKKELYLMKLYTRVLMKLTAR